MGKANTSVNQWLRDNHRFASLYNGYVFGGRQIIRPEELEDLDRETDILVTDKAGKTKVVGRRRDIVKRWKNNVDLAILACESQDKIHYAMPVRCMLYDGLTYTDQIRELWRMHRGGGAPQGKGELSTEEFLSRFRREDFIYPILTLVFYYDEKKWDGATDLYGMFPPGTEGKDGEWRDKRGFTEICAQLSDEPDRCGTYGRRRTAKTFGRFTTGTGHVKI